MTVADVKCASVCFTGMVTLDAVRRIRLLLGADRLHCGKGKIKGLTLKARADT